MQLRCQQEHIASAGLGVALIGLGTPDQAHAFRAEFDLPFALLCDPAKISYRAFGLLRINPLREARPDTIRRYLAATAQFGGNTLTPGQDPLQLGGVFSIDRRGIVRYVHYALRIADYPDISAILAEVARTPLSE